MVPLRDANGQRKALGIRRRINQNGRCPPHALRGDCPMPEPDSTSDGTRAAPKPGAYQAALTLPDGVPARIGKFEIKALLGEGAFGRVYLGFDAELERQVAIKVPKSEGLTTDLRERFLREARATAKIHHPNVCPVHEVGTDGDVPYIVMYYLAGTTLAAHLDKWKVLPPLHAVALAQKLALGMAAAHEKNVIHRDLKPQNVLFDPTRQLVLITDFGLARIGGTAQGTLVGAVFGTPLYMSPEQARGEVDQVGPLSDVYALGVILYRMLTGDVPFKGSVYEVLLQHCDAAPVAPSVARRGLDPRLDRLCLKALAKKPADRYPSSKAFADALGDYVRAGDSTAWQGADEGRERQPADPLPAPPPPVPPIPPTPFKLNPGEGSGRRSSAAVPAARPGTRPAPALPPPLEPVDDGFAPPAADDGSVRQKVLIGGVVLLFALTLVGLAVVILNSGSKPTTELTYVPPAPDPKAAPAVPGPAPKTVEPPPRPPADLPSAANGFAGHKEDPAAERRAAEWVLAVGGELKVAIPGEVRTVTRKDDLPAGFTVASIDIRAKPDLSEDEMKTNLAGLTGPLEVFFRDCGQLGDDTIQVLARVPKLKTLFVLRASRVTDKSLAALAGHPKLNELLLQNTSVSKEGIRHVPSLPALHKLTLVVPDTDEWLPLLAPMEGLTHLNLDAEGPRYLSAQGLAHLKPFTRLRHLTLFGRVATDEWLEQLVKVAPFDELVELDLRETSVEGPGLVHLKALKQLDWIDVGTSRITDAGMANLAALPKLRWLYADGTTISDAGLRPLAGSKTLEVLTLKDNKKVTDKGMAHLADCPKLLELDLTNTGIGDAGVSELARCKSLKKLTLTGTRVTAKGVRELKAALPGCEVVRAEKK